MARLLRFFPIVSWYSFAIAQSPVDVPIVVAPSGKWSGPDGPWSTFNLGVGEPFQAFQGVPGLSSALTLLPIAATSCDETTCPGRAVFSSDRSSSWVTAGLYSVPLPYYYTDRMFMSENGTTGATWGIDVVYFGNSARDVSSKNYVVGTSSREFGVATFGLSAGEVGLAGATMPTLLTDLRRNGDIPSSSFSYTAGSVNRNSSGSLILGGYDTSRFDAGTTISLPMPSRMNNSLVITVEAIGISGLRQRTWAPSEPGKASFNIDSTIPNIWLPIEACAAFEEVFDIVWDDAAQLYLLNETTHAQLQQSNPVVNITIRESEKRSVEYSLPFTAFDLTATAPLVNGTPSRYFPLKRASNWQEYVLGRTFLQEIYVSVDYERSRFNISQAYPEGGSSRVIPVLPPIESTTNMTAPGAVPADHINLARPLSTAAIVGIAVGISIMLSMIMSLLFVWRRRWRLSHRGLEQAQECVDKAEMDGDSKPWIEPMSNERSELETQEYSNEIADFANQIVELEGNHAFYELAAGHCNHSSRNH